MKGTKKMIKKLALICMLGTASAGAAMFEESPAYAHAGPLFKVTHDHLSQLEPVQILLPRNSLGFTRLYVDHISEIFHLVVTPLLQFKARSYLKDHETNMGAIEIYLRDERNTLMADCVQKAFTFACTYRNANLDDPDFLAPSPLFGSLMSLRHYRDTEISAGRSVTDIVVAEIEATQVEADRNINATVVYTPTEPLTTAQYVDWLTY